MVSIFITPGFSGKKPLIKQPGVETFQRSFPQDPEKFCTPFCSNVCKGAVMRINTVSVVIFTLKFKA